MYKKTGVQIQRLASFFVVFEIIVSEIVALICLFLFCANVNFTAETESTLTFELNFIFLLCSFIFGLVLPILSWQKYLFTAGFGELIEDANETKNELADIKKILISTLNYDESNLYEEDHNDFELNTKHIKLISEMHDNGELTDDEFNKLMNEINQNLGN